MRGITPRREQGMADPVLAEMVHATGATESRHYAAVKPTIQAYRASWVKLAPYRDGPMNSQRVTVSDPAAVTTQIKAKATDLPLLEDQPREFGVQDFCMNCNVCQLNCPGDAIPQDHVMTHGIKRWLIDLEKCYPYSRLREEYCHLGVDACPYIVKSHPETYKAFMKERKQVGYKTPKTY